MSTLEERFEAKVDRSAGKNACHPWTGAVDSHGYGVFRDGDRLVGAHKHELEKTTVSLPGFVSEHRCHTRDLTCEGGKTCLHRRCCNPRHLEHVTVLENNLRGRRCVPATQKEAA